MCSYRQLQDNQDTKHGEDRLIPCFFPVAQATGRGFWRRELLWPQEAATASTFAACRTGHCHARYHASSGNLSWQLKTVRTFHERISSYCSCFMLFYYCPLPCVIKEDVFVYQHFVCFLCPQRQKPFWVN